jgi:hypothetical protein
MNGFFHTETKMEKQMAKRKRTTGQTMTYTTLHRRLKIEQDKLH